METLSWLLFSLIILLGIVVGILFSFYFLQEKLIFNPISLPKNYKFPFSYDFEERFYKVDERIELSCLLCKTPKSKGLIFYIHGNADNLRYWGEFAPFFLKKNYDVFMFDYRGFGKSDGKIKGERMLQRDTKILYNKMLQEYKEENIIIYGFSIGTGIASRLASRNHPKCLILEAPYFNFIELVKYHKSYLPANLISKYYFRTNRYLTEVEVPIYIFHGTEDRKVPFYLGEKLKGANPRLKFIAIKGATHNDMQKMKKYKKWMAEILH